MKTFALICIFSSIALLICAREIPREKSILKAKTDMESIVDLCLLYKHDNGNLPAGSSIDIIRKLTDAYENEQPLIEDNKENIKKGAGLVDPWGMPYEILITAQGGIFVISAGPDGDFSSQNRIILYQKPRGRPTDGNP